MLKNKNIEFVEAWMILDNDCLHTQQCNCKKCEKKKDKEKEEKKKNESGESMANLNG